MADVDRIYPNPAKLDPLHGAAIRAQGVMHAYWISARGALVLVWHAVQFHTFACIVPVTFV